MRPVAGVLLLMVLSACLGDQPNEDPTPSAPAPSSAAPLPERLRWREAAPAPTPRAEHSGVFVGDKFYAVGGFIIPTPVTAQTPSQVPTYVPTARLEIYDATQNRWTTGPDYPLNLDHAPMVAFDGKAYVFYWGGAPAGSQAYKFDPAANQWSRIASMPRSHNAGVAEVIGDRVFVTGGGGEASTIVDVYDPRNDTWSSLESRMPTRRDHTGSAVVNGKMYVVAGDVGGHSRNTANNEEFDPSSGLWRARSPVPVVRGSVHAVEWLGRVVVLGGQNGPNGVAAFDDADAYEPGGDSWSKLPDMPSGRHGFAAGVWSDRIYVFAGAPQMGVTGFDKVHVLEAAP